MDSKGERTNKEDFIVSKVKHPEVVSFKIISKMYRKVRYRLDIERMDEMKIKDGRV